MRLSATFLGLTYGCARCHNHKYDPILQADYYRLQAFYANTAADDQIALLPSEAAAKREIAQWQPGTRRRRTSVPRCRHAAPRKQKILKDFVDKYPPEIQAAIAKPAAERNPYEWQMYYKAKPYLEIDDEAAMKTLKGDDKNKYVALKANSPNSPICIREIFRSGSECET